MRFLLPLLALVPAIFAEAPKTASQFTFIRGQELAAKQSALQTLSTEFKPADGNGPSVWLIGVAHLGTREYYDAIQKRLDTQTVVLFEGVGAEKLKDGAKLDSGAGIQGQMAKALGLLFQLDAIDYKRAHFVNCDLTVDGLQKAITERSTKTHKSEPSASPSTSKDSPSTSSEKQSGNESSLPPKVDNETFQSLMDALHGEGEMGQNLGSMLGLLGSTPEMRETTKLMMVEALSQASELIDLAKTMSPDIKDLFEVLITERNDEVIRQLKDQLPKLSSGKTIAVFYGAAHMDEIAKRLTDQLHYVPAAQQWDTAFSADAGKSIMPPEQIKSLMQMMRLQMQNPNAGGADGAKSLPLLNLFNPQPSTKGSAPASK